MGTISGCRHLEVNYLKIINIFLIEDFSICHQCQRHPQCTLSCKYLREFSKKLETALMVYSGAWGKLIHEKQKLKSRGTVPLTWSCRFLGPVEHAWQWPCSSPRRTGVAVVRFWASDEQTDEVASDHVFSLKQIE
jgi:hypothetical protein